MAVTVRVPTILRSLTGGQSEVPVDGAGTLAGIANGNPHNIDSFRQPHHYTWHGQALAVLAPAKHPGRLTLTASASGLRSPALAISCPRAASRLARAGSSSVAPMAAFSLAMTSAGVPCGAQTAVHNET